MGFGKHMAALVAEVDEHLGDRATWSGVAGEVRVLPAEEDAIARYGDASHVLTARAVEIHERWIALPAEGDQVQILDDDTGAVREILRVIGDPRRNEDGWWLCTVVLVGG
ncbi:head-tail joining protein [Brevundimonas faecalis]|uniref:Head-tail adaptor protein n=1 Tax=Brevundimonas faecalis TaxID=947378 RepID=A0ABV2RAT2_9CAUL